jgi:DNA (cytosine-5)-methyltransferase 1
MPRKKSFVTVTDMFCGAGGSSQGATNGGCEVVMAMNHWKLAVETHNTNFPQVNHDCADNGRG